MKTQHVTELLLAIIAGVLFLIAAVRQHNSPGRWGDTELCAIGGVLVSVALVLITLAALNLI